MALINSAVLILFFTQCMILMLNLKVPCKRISTFVDMSVSELHFTPHMMGSNYVSMPKNVMIEVGKYLFSNVHNAIDEENPNSH